MAGAAILSRLPNLFHPDRCEAAPSDLIGSRIIGFGTSNERIEGGGLFIDYQPPAKPKKRLVLAFNEAGMWVEYHSNQGGSPKCDP